MEVIGSIYTNVSDDFQNGIIGGCISRCVKTEKHDLGVVLMERKLGNIFGFQGGNYAGNVYDKDFECPTLNTMQGGCKQPMIVAMRGRNPTNPSDRTPGIETEQRLEPNTHGTCNTLTSVQKDNLVMESVNKVGQISSDNSQYGTVLSENVLCSTLQAGTHGYANNCIQTQYRIRKLTPRECWRLMNFSDEDFEKAAEVNSNTQLYKQAGNSIVKNVLVAILGQMIPGKENLYKEL